jgi:MFS family permease
MNRVKNYLVRSWDSLHESKRNYLLFCIYYACVHGAVDAVLAFSAAELGTDIGSLGGSVLYIFYTFSALFMAKPSVQFLEAKRTVFIGLIGLLIYVLGFYLAILFPNLTKIFFLTGCSVGGVGAGLLWTGQGAYYSLNATIFASASNISRSEAITTFAAIFAGFYLSFETAYKFIATLVFILAGMQSNGHWRPAVFGLYTVSAFICTCLFSVSLQDYKEKQIVVSWQESPEVIIDHEQTSGEKLMSKNQHNSSQLPLTTFRNVFQDSMAVGKALIKIRKLQLLIPYQICFGLSAGLVDTYVNGVIVNHYIGEGYIGLLSGLVTLTAAILSGPFAMIGTKYTFGNSMIMIFGAVCFALGGLILLTLNDSQISTWPVIIFYYIIHGAARGVWENTNKAVIAEYFPHKDQRDAAFASVYFSSGLAGAMGFAFFQFLNKYVIAAINLSISCVALFCFLAAKAVHDRDIQTLDPIADSSHFEAMSPFCEQGNSSQHGNESSVSS